MVPPGDTGADFSALDELLASKLRTLSELLADPHTVEEIEAEVAALSDLLDAFKRRDARKPPASAQTARILCVEDDEDTCEMLAVAMEGDYELVTAGSVAEGLRLAQSDGFALYILDNWLPDGTGIELCQQIRAFDPRTPIIFCSGVAPERDQQEATEAGAQAYLVKPVLPEELMQAIAQLLSPGNAATGKPA